MYRVSVQQGHLYTVKTGCGDGASAGFDTIIEVYNASCELLASDDDACESQRSSVSWTALATGYNYVKVRGYNGAGGGYVLAYRGTTQCPECPDYNYTLGNPTTSWQCDDGSAPAGGCFMYRIYLQAGHAYIFKTGCGDGAMATFDTIIETYHPSCAPGPGDDDGCESNRSIVTWTPSNSGYQYVKVGGYGGVGGDYTLAYKEVCDPPVAPTAVSASDGTYCDKVRVTWDSASGAASYRVYRSATNSQCPEPPLANAVTGTQYDDTSATPGTTYHYSVKATNSCGDGPCSRTDSGYRRAVPETATGVSATDGTYCDKVRVTWDSVSGATSYMVYRGTSNSPCPEPPLATGVSDTQYDDTWATAGITYYYSVKATNSCGDGACSATDSGLAAIGDLTADTLWLSKNSDDCDRECVARLLWPGRSVWPHFQYAWSGTQHSPPHDARIYIRRVFLGTVVHDRTVPGPDFAPGETKCVWSDLRWHAQVGFFALTGEADPDDQVMECDGGSNEAQIAFHVPTFLFSTTSVGSAPGTDASYARAINDAGQVAGFCSANYGFQNSAFVWTDGLMTMLPALPGYGSCEAYGINGSGNAVGLSGPTTAFPPATRATLWVSGTPIDLGALGGTHSAAYAISNSSQVVGWAELPEVEPNPPHAHLRHAFIWTQGDGMTNLGTLGGLHSQASGISESGWVVGSAMVANGRQHAFVVVPEDGSWYRDDDGNGINDLMIDLGDGAAVGVNSAGIVAGSFTNGGTTLPQAALWAPESRGRSATYPPPAIIVLPVTGTTESYAQAINEFDQIVGKAKRSDGTWYAFVVDGCDAVELNAVSNGGTDWDLTEASDINNNAQIAGSGTLSGASPGFVLTPARSAPDRKGDADGDGDIDTVDIAKLAGCIGGPQAAPSPPAPGCPDDCLLIFDMNLDGDVDIQDCATIQLLYTGPIAP